MWYLMEKRLKMQKKLLSNGLIRVSTLLRQYFIHHSIFDSLIDFFEVVYVLIAILTASIWSNWFDQFF